MSLGKWSSWPPNDGVRGITYHCMTTGIGGHRGLAIELSESGMQDLWPKDAGCVEAGGTECGLTINMVLLSHQACLPLGIYGSAAQT